MLWHWPQTSAERFEESTQPGTGEMYSDYLLKAEDGVTFTV